MVAVAAAPQRELAPEQPPAAEAQTHVVRLQVRFGSLQTGAQALQPAPLLVQPEGGPRARLRPLPVVDPLAAFALRAPLQGFHPLGQLGDRLLRGRHGCAETLDPYQQPLPRRVHLATQLHADGVELPRRQSEAGQVLRLALVAVPAAHVQVHVQVPLHPAVQFADGIQGRVEGLIGDLRLEARLHPIPPP
jgi:hypothetical protein